MPLDDTDARHLEQQLAAQRQERQARRRVRVARVRIVKEAVASAGATVLRDLVGIAGMLLLSFGAWSVYKPAGYIVCGGLMLAGAWLSGARE